MLLTVGKNSWLETWWSDYKGSPAIPRFIRLWEAPFASGGAHAWFLTETLLSCGARVVQKRLPSQSLLTRLTDSRRKLWPSHPGNRSLVGAGTWTTWLPSWCSSAKGSCGIVSWDLVTDDYPVVMPEGYWISIPSRRARSVWGATHEMRWALTHDQEAIRWK